MKKFILVRAVRFLYFNFFKRIFFIDFILDNVYRRLSIYLNSGITLLIEPEFKNESEFLETFYRINWYFKPIENRIKEINFNILNNDISYIMPKFFNQDILNHQISKEKISFNLNIKNKWFHNKYNYIILKWDVSDKTPKLLKNEININSKHEGMGSVMSLKFAAKNFDNKKFLKNSKIKLKEIKNSIESDSVLIIGSGPNSKQILDKNIEISDVIVCNSVIKNDQFMKKFKPKFVVFGDPTWHSGPSKYVEEFQKSLIQTIEKYDSTIITVERDAHIIKEYIPKEFHHKFIFIPVVKTDKKTNLNFNLSRKFYVAGTNNILTLLLLPISFYLYKNIYFAGFDGNPDKVKKYFWKHNKDSQFDNEFSSMRLAHPYIFEKETMDYDFIYENHLKKINEWFHPENLEHRKLTNLTDSHMDPFKIIS